MSLAKRIFVTLFFQLGGQIASVLVGAVLARTLGPAGKGATAYAVTGLSLVTMYFNGQNQAIAYQFGRKKLHLNSVYRAMMHIFFWTAPLCMILLVAIALIVPSQRVLIAAAAAVPFALYAQFCTQFFLVIGRPMTANIQSLLSTVLYALVIIPLMYFAHAGVVAALAVWILSIVAGAIYSYVHIYPYISGKRPYNREVATDEEIADVKDPAARRAILREQVAFMSKAGFSSFASYLNLRIDVMIVSFTLGAAELGIYTLAISTGELIWKIAQAVTWPSLARIASETPERSAQLVATITRNIFTLQAAIALVLFFAAPPLMHLVYGRAFDETAIALRLLLPGLVAYSTEGAIGYFFSVQKGTPIFRFCVLSSSIVLCASVTLATIHRFSIYGAAVATSVSYLMVVTVMTILFTRATGIPVVEMFILQRSDVERYRRMFEKIAKSFGVLRRT